MSHRYLLEALDTTLRDITESENVMGGKLLVLAGDFRQILPVVRKGRRADIVNACMSKSHLWRHVTTFKLRENMPVKQQVS